MKSITMFLSLSLLVLGMALPAWAENRALMIGVGQYPNLQANLPGIDRDLAAMKETAGRLGFSSSQIKVLADEQATQANVLAAIRDWLIAGVTPNDKALFYFSGHGSYILDKKSNSPDGISQVLFCHDTAVEGVTLIRVLVDHEFGDLLDQLHSRMTIVFLDACHSGTMTRDATPTSKRMVYPRFFEYPGMPRLKTRGVFSNHAQKVPPANAISLSAATDDEQALGDNAGGFFTRGLSESIQKAATEKRPETIEDLRVQAGQFIAAKTPPKEKVHHPYVFGPAALARIDLLQQDEPVASNTGASGPAPPPDTWQQLTALADKASYQVEVAANRSQFRIGDPLVLTIKPPRVGYLTVLSLNQGDQKATVLYPNKIHPGNRLETGGRVTIPAGNDGFALQAQPPPGQALVVVFHTEKEINAYWDGEGPPLDMFRSLSTRSIRGLAAKETQGSGSFGAGKLILQVTN